MSTQRRFGLALLVFSIIAIAFLTLSPALAGDRESRWCLVCGRQIVGDLLLNVALFMPAGIGLALLGISRLRAVGFALVATVAIELTQGFILRGRFASVSDIITNTSGAVIGHAVGSQWRMLLFPPVRIALGLAGGILLAWLAILAGAAWALTPPLESGEYRVVALDARARDGTTDVVKDVALLRAIGDSALIDAGSAFDDALRRRELVLLARFRPTSADTVIAFTHRVGSPPAISIGHWGGLLTIVVHTPARALYLQEPTIFWGPVGFLASTRDTLVTIAGGVDGDSIRLFALRDAEIIEHSSLGLAPSLWLYLLIGAGPGLQYVEALSALLNVALLAPAAYWAAIAMARSRQRLARRVVGLLSALVLFVTMGFAGVPWWADLAPTPLALWVVALAGVAASGIAGARAGWSLQHP